jgi:hypothetical protein
MDAHAVDKRYREECEVPSQLHVMDPDHRTAHDVDKIQRAHTVESEVGSVLYDDSQHIKVHHYVQFQREVSVIGVHVLDSIVLHATDGMGYKPFDEGPRCGLIPEISEKLNNFLVLGWMEVGDQASKYKKKSAAPPKKVLAGRKSGSLVTRDQPLSSENLIPVLNGLDTSEASFGSVEESMNYNDSFLDKRHAMRLLGYEQDTSDGKALVLFVDVPAGGVKKKGEMELHHEGECTQQRLNDQMEDDVSSMACEVDKEATGPGAAGELTGPNVAPRQEQ